MKKEEVELKSLKRDMKKVARRYNSGKLKYNLIPASFLKELARVYTIGAEKYTIRDDEGNNFRLSKFAGDFRKYLNNVGLTTSTTYNGNNIVISIKSK